MIRSVKQVEAAVARKQWWKLLGKAAFKYTLYAVYKGFWLIAIEGYVFALKVKYELIKQWGPKKPSREARRQYVKQVGRKMTTGKYYGQVDGNVELEQDRIRRKLIQYAQAKSKS